MRAWQAGAELVALEGGGWGHVPQQWLDKHGAKVADLLAASGGSDRVPMHALPDLGRLCEELDLPPPPDLQRLRPLVEEFVGLPHAPLPAGLGDILRPYQRAGVDWLAFCRDAGLGCVLADDMGLGKTIQALAAIRGRTLVVSPTSVVWNWADEVRKFRPDLRASVYHGSKRALDITADIVLTSYPLLRNDIDVLTGVEWDAVYLDESQMIKNPDSQVARAAYKLRADWRVTLSGTPVENRLDELWSQFHFTNPGLLGGRADFAERWGTPIANGDPGAAARLRERIKPFVLRRKKREVAPELPPRTEAVMHVELDEAEREVYDTIRAATQRDVVAMLSQGGGVMAALEALLRLRQASCHRGLIPGQSAASSSKVERLVEALEDAAADGHKALVFSQWTSLLDKIEPALEAAGIAFTRLDGSTVDRQGVVSEFQSDGGPPVMLISLKAGGTGLNLTAADHVFLVDPWWNPAVEDQAADRAHRIGQDKPVMVYRLVARDTVEERILALQASKRALAEAALGGADRAVALTRDDLLALLA
jgi:SNF2 family DNA or RNA helicase